MRKFGLLGTSALGSFTAIGFAMALATPAYAQQVEEEKDPTCATMPEGTERDNCIAGEVETESGTAASETAGGEIVVTGSRIRRPNLESTVPITSIGGEEFFETGRVSVGDVLNDLPALRSTFSQANSTRFLGTAGLNLLDLRGLGTQRTLVLVNGRRHVGGDILNNAVSVDTNTIPTDLIDRVDIVTGGNSAIYGSDAIAGVVNFVLKNNYDGFQIRGQGGVSKYGDAGSYFASALAGRNFAGDRGNIAINLEYAQQEQYFGSGRPNLAQNNGFVVVDTDPAGTPNGSDGNPDRVFFRDIRSATLTNTGLVQLLGPGASATNNCGTASNGSFFNCPIMFDTAGNLTPITGTRIGIGPNGNFIGGNGESFRGADQFQIQPLLKRYNANVVGHFTLSEAFEPFFEAKYSRTETRGAGSSGPAFITGTTLGDTRERIRLDNPFLAPAARTFIASELLRTGVNLNTGTALTAAQRAQITAGTFRFNFRENLLGLGVRNERATRETWRGVVGVRGDFNDDWRYEVSANYGKFKEETIVGGNLNVQRFLLALDAARATPTGPIQCRSQFDPTAAIPYNNNGVEDLLAADVAACIPINPFGGQFTEAQRAYLLQDTTSVGKISQFVGSAFLSGDSSQLFNLPGGPIGFALGAEYRRETNFFQADPLVEQGYTFYNALSTFTSPAFEVKEAFGEIRLPLLKDTPFFEELTVSAAGRIADYKGSTGTVYAYNVGADWVPVRDLRLRGNFSRAVRAPNLGELFSAPGQNFAPGFLDPCSARNIGTGSSTRAANCAAAGAPAGYDFVYSQSLEIVSGGNPNLKEETSDSWTFGGVLQPRMIPGLSVSIDYYNITVNDVITSVAAQTIVNQCYDQATLQNPFCDLFQRAGAGGGPRGEVPFQILEGSLLQSSLNFAKLKARGVDAEVSYRRKFDFGSIGTRFTYTHVIQRDNFLNPADPTFVNVIRKELGDPKDAFNWNVDLKAGKYTLGYQMRFIGKQYLNTYEDYNATNGQPPQNADYADIKFYPTVFYHDLRLGIDATDRFNFYLGVDNVLNKQPPFGLTGIGAGSAIYDIRGRFFYGGVVAKF